MKASIISILRNAASIVVAVLVLLAVLIGVPAALDAQWAHKMKNKTFTTTGVAETSSVEVDSTLTPLSKLK